MGARGKKGLQWACSSVRSPCAAARPPTGEGSAALAHPVWPGFFQNETKSFRVVGGKRKNFLPLSSRKDPPSYSFRSASPRRRGGARAASLDRLLLRALFTGKLSPTTRSLKASRGSTRGKYPNSLLVESPQGKDDQSASVGTKQSVRCTESKFSYGVLGATAGEQRSRNTRTWRATRPR